MFHALTPYNDTGKKSGFQFKNKSKINEIRPNKIYLIAEYIINFLFILQIKNGRPYEQG